MELEQVVDGDTLRLASGDKVRLVGINTPELGRKNRPAEPLAKVAKQSVEDFFKDTTSIGLSLGQEDRDRYGRILAGVYHQNGQSLSAHLLQRGLAIQVVIPPNTDNWQCLKAIQQGARQQELGLWGEGYYAPMPADQLSAEDAGFRRVSGVVEKVSSSRSAYWLDIGKLAVRIPKKHLQYFSTRPAKEWIGKELIVTGWVVDRSNSESVRTKGYQPFKMQVGHPAMMTLTEQ